MVQIDFKTQPIPIGPTSLNSVDFFKKLPVSIGTVVANLPTGQITVSASLVGSILTVTLPIAPAKGINFGIGGQLIF